MWRRISRGRVGLDLEDGKEEEEEEMVVTLFRDEAREVEVSVGFMLRLGSVGLGGDMVAKV
jgi:hypothetical protein